MMVYYVIYIVLLWIIFIISNKYHIIYTDVFFVEKKMIRLVVFQILVDSIWTTYGNKYLTNNSALSSIQDIAEFYIFLEWYDIIYAACISEIVTRIEIICYRLPCWSYIIWRTIAIEPFIILQSIIKLFNNRTDTPTQIASLFG